MNHSAPGPKTRAPGQVEATTASELELRLDAIAATARGDYERARQVLDAIHLHDLHRQGDGT